MREFGLRVFFQVATGSIQGEGFQSLSVSLQGIEYFRAPRCAALEWSPVGERLLSTINFCQCIAAIEYLYNQRSAYVHIEKSNIMDTGSWQQSWVWCGPGLLFILRSL